MAYDPRDLWIIHFTYGIHTEYLRGKRDSLFERPFIRSDGHPLPNRSYSRHPHFFRPTRHFRKSCSPPPNFAMPEKRPILIKRFSKLTMNPVVSFVKCTDPTTNKPYYFNKITHEAQWAAPSSVTMESKEESDTVPELPCCNYVRYWIIPLQDSTQKWLQNMKSGLQTSCHSKWIWSSTFWDNMKRDGERDSFFRMTKDSSRCPASFQSFQSRFGVNPIQQHTVFECVVTSVTLSAIFLDQERVVLGGWLACRWI